METVEYFGKAKCGQPFILKRDGQDITVEVYVQNTKLLGHLDQTVRKSHKISDQVRDDVNETTFYYFH